MHWGTDLYLKLLGVGELVENAGAVLEDWLLRGRRRPPAGLQGSTAIVTGGNAGVGLATAEALLRHGAGTVVLACRSQERGAAAAARLAAAVGGAGERVQVEALDLADLSSVRAFARRWADSGRPLDLLVLNAGIMCPPERVETVDGFELQFQSNYLGHFELANRLVRHVQRQRQRTRRQPAHAAAAAAAAGKERPGGGRRQQQQQQEQEQGQPQGQALEAGRQRPLRVLFLSSMTHMGADLSSPGAWADLPHCRRWHPFQAYCNSKMCTLLAAKHLDSLLARDACQSASAGSAGGGGGGGSGGQRDAAVAVHPGLVDTLLARGYFRQMAPAALRPLTDPFFDRAFCPHALRSPEAAARTVLYAATAPAEEVGGRYVGTAPKVSRHSRAADDPALAARLWDLSAHLCGLEGGDDLVR